DLDPHSKYLPPDDYEEVRISTTGNYSGIGLDVSIEDGKVSVVAPLVGAPAANAGILPGDVLLAVDGVPVDSDNLEHTVSRMRGAPGTIVRLEVRRDGVEEPLELALTRADIHVQTVRAERADGRVGYFRIASFSNTTDEDLEAAAAELEARVPGGLEGMVLDLRNNPGGVLEAAIDVADLFLAE